MGHHGQMHAQPGVGTCPDAPVKVKAGREPGLEAEDATGEATGEAVPPAPIAPNADHREQRHLPATSFRSRRSALSGAQRQTWERLWSKIGIAAGTPSGEGPRRAEPLD